MAETADDPMAACDGLAAPMGELIGGAAAVPAFAAGALPLIEVPLAAVAVGGAAAYNSYEHTSQEVQDNWHSDVCVPMEHLAAPETVTPPITPDFADSHDAAPTSDNGYVSSYEPDHTSYDAGLSSSDSGSSFSDSGSSGSSDGGSSSSDS